MSARVVLLSTNLARGGAESQVAQLAAALRRRGWEASVVSLLAPTAHTEALAAAGVPVFTAAMLPGRPDPRAWVRLARILGALRPHVLHGHMFHANLAARLARLVLPVPVVVSTIHSIAESPRGSAPLRGRDRLYRVTGWLAGATVCVSEAVAERHAAARAVSARRLRVIPNGVDTTLFRPDAARRADTRAALALGGEFAWLAVGRLMWKKDYPTMLDAMARQPGGVLLIAGEGPLDAELRALAARLGARARFLGPREDIPALMNACDGLLLSSIVEGLPMVLLEAAASGLPAVAAGVGGVREAVLDGRTGYVVPPGDPAALAAAMARQASLDAETRARMSAAAREHASVRFDIATVAEQWERLYLELLASARRRDLEPCPHA